MSYIIKTVLAALLIVVSSEAAKRSPLMGALIISLPITSIIAMCFLYYDGQDAGKIAEFARSIPPVLLPSVAFFYGFSFLIESHMGFVMAMVLATGLMLGGYGAFLMISRNG